MKAKNLEYEVQQQPMLPKWTAKTLYGMEHAAEFDPQQENLVSNRHSNRPPFPRRQAGSVELPHTPLFVSTKRHSAIVHGQNTAEELPWKLVSADRDELPGAYIEPLVLNTAAGTHENHYNAAIGNRHIPRNLEMYYFEAEEVQEGAGFVIGLVQFKTRYAAYGEKHPSRRSSNNGGGTNGNGNGAGSSAGNGNGTGAGIRGGNRVAGRLFTREGDEEQRRTVMSYILNEIDESQDVYGYRTDPESEAEGTLEVDEAANDEENDGNVGDDNEDDSGDDLEDDEDDEDDDDEVFDDDDDDDDEDDDDDDDDEALDNDDNDDADEDIQPARIWRGLRGLESTSQLGYPGDDDEARLNRPLGGFSVYRDGRQPKIFSASEVVYDRRPDHGTDEVWLNVLDTKTLAPMVHWDVKRNFIVHNGENTPLTVPDPTISAKRAGIIVDRIHNTVEAVADGKSLKPAVKISFNPENGELFPFVLLKSSQCRVYFGDGRRPNDGFVFGIQDYVQSSVDSMLSEARKKLEVDDMVEDSDSSAFQDPTTYLRTEFHERHSAFIDHCNEAASEYMRFYGYGVDLSGGQRPATNDDQLLSDEQQLRMRIRTAVEALDFAEVRSLLANFDVPFDAQFLLELHEFVTAAKEPATRLNAISMGQRLGANTNLSEDQRQMLNEASAILVSKPPRPRELAKYYSPEARTDLIRALLKAIPNTASPVFQKVAETAASDEHTDDPKKAAVVAALRRLGNNSLWKW